MRHASYALAVATLWAQACGGAVAPARSGGEKATGRDTASSWPGDSDDAAAVASIPRRLPLSQLRVTTRHPIPRLDVPLELVLHTRNPGNIAELLRRRYAEVDVVGPAAVRFLGDPRADSTTDTQDPAYLKPSFFVDYDEPAVQRLVARVSEATNGSPAPSALRAFVRGHFQGVSHGGFDPASRAAMLRKGDCSEHAVLLAALARAFGMPARVVLGYVLVREPELIALGHAWTEIAVGNSWTRVDAALDTNQPHAYLALAALEHEGPGYVLENPMLEFLLAVEGIEIAEARP